METLIGNTNVVAPKLEYGKNKLIKYQELYIDKFVERKKMMNLVKKHNLIVKNAQITMKSFLTMKKQ